MMAGKKLNMYEYLPAMLMIPALLLLVLFGFPVSLSLIVIAFVFAVPVFETLAGLQLYNFIDQVASNYVLAAVPMFVFIGAVLERSQIAERLFAAMRLWLEDLPGGLALATIAMSAVFAAGTGIVGAVEVMVGMMAIPPMMKAKYKKELIAGTICAGGSLGTIIPPSIVVVIYASYARLSVGDLFAGILVPGLMMVAFFMIYIAIVGARHRSNDAPVTKNFAKTPFREKVRQTVIAIFPPALLMVAVLGSIFSGLAAVTEAAAVGCVGVLVLAILYRRLSFRLAWESLAVTSRLTAMILLIVVGGTMFASVFIIHQGGELVSAAIALLGVGEFGTVIVLLAIVFVLGALLDWVSVLTICLPIFIPILSGTDIDPIWFAVLTIVVIQTSYLTPPMAPSIFYLRAIAPPGMTFGDMYRGVLPFVLAQLAVLVVLLLFPGIISWAS
jgi:tripartite ATP-independent transporter DctM subunit